MRIKTRKYKEGESLPSDVCPGCRNHKKSRSGMGTCGHRDCIDYLNTISINGATKDDKDPATGQEFRNKRTGKVYKGSYSFGEGKNTGVKMKDGSSFRLSDLEAMD
jgi:hypothetical protein